VQRAGYLSSVRKEEEDLKRASVKAGDETSLNSAEKKGGKDEISEKGRVAAMQRRRGSVGRSGAPERERTKDFPLEEGRGDILYTREEGLVKRVRQKGECTSSKRRNSSLAKGKIHPTGNITENGSKGLLYSVSLRKRERSRSSEREGGTTRYGWVR